MLCKVEEHLGDLHNKIDKILCLVNPEQDSLLEQATRIEKYLNLALNGDGKSLGVLREDYPMFNFYRGVNKFTVTVKGEYL